MISFINKTKYYDEIISLWMDCFGDSVDYISFFLDNCQSECIGYIEKDKLISMLFLLEGKIGEFRLKYIYAACTDRQFRRKGLMGKLIEFVKAYCSNLKYDGIFLVPGEETLYGYYDKFGFENIFFRNEISINGSLQFSNFSKLNNVKLISQIRKELLKNIDSFIFDEKTLEYSVSEYLNNGGSVLYKKEKESQILLFFHYDNKKYVIKELLCSKNADFINFVKHFTINNNENVYILCPIVYNSADIVVKSTKCGMCFFITEKFRMASLNKCFYAGIYLD